MTLEEISHHDIAGASPGGRQHENRARRKATHGRDKRGAHMRNRAPSKLQRPASGCANQWRNRAQNSAQQSASHRTISPTKRPAIKLQSRGQRTTRGATSRGQRANGLPTSGQQRATSGATSNGHHARRRRPASSRDARQARMQSRGPKRAGEEEGAAAHGGGRRPSITDSACKNQLVVVSVQYGLFNPYIPIRSTTIGKSRVAIDPIAMHTSWRSNSDIASVTSKSVELAIQSPQYLSSNCFALSWYVRYSELLICAALALICSCSKLVNQLGCPLRSGCPLLITFLFIQLASISVPALFRSGSLRTVSAWTSSQYALVSICYSALFQLAYELLHSSSSSSLLSLYQLASDLHSKERISRDRLDEASASKRKMGPSNPVFHGKKQNFEVSPHRAVSAVRLMRIELGGAFADLLNEQSKGSGDNEMGYVERTLGFRTRDLEDRDLRLVTEIVGGTIRWRRYLDYLILSMCHDDNTFRSMEPLLLQILRIGFYEIVKLEMPPYAVVDENVKVAKFALRPGAGNMVNAVLRKLVVLKESNSLPLPTIDGDDRQQARALATIHSHPVVPYEISHHLDDFVRIKAGLQRADLRWNRSLEDMEQLKTLQDELLDSASTSQGFNQYMSARRLSCTRGGRAGFLRRYRIHLRASRYELEQQMMENGD
ncbi:putative 28S rRNA (cytosine-C(5))-methyltransferase [Dorcoceras hygrometricum]|uniref:Putative 28S rRNA (Cytosine-C(5))-methyltransferase n=1 Tax=Dorcoceras hygrometricum TaxID=472368 RepID=A0A2Z7CDY7_9LAMI|nr:putative 28S rRNA (cytosine-C(5))-methyltransferase [Dorcoceras hygrometricum]